MNLSICALAAFVCEVPPGKRSTHEIFQWWNDRRLLFSTLVAVAGLPSILIYPLRVGAADFLSYLCCVFSLIVFGLFYLLLVNVLYSVGALVEILVWFLLKEHCKCGPLFYSLGLLCAIPTTIFLETIVIIMGTGI
jgi:hypothetical protein